MHKFIMYMLPTDISNALNNGNISYSRQCYFSAVIKPAKCRWRYCQQKRSVVAPNTVIEMYFSLGESSEISLGRFYIDRCPSDIRAECVTYCP